MPIRRLVPLLAVLILCASAGPRPHAAAPKSATAHAPAPRTAGPRNVGGDLRFLDPPSDSTDYSATLGMLGVPDGLDVFDLGDAAPGERIERVMHVAGGLKPYRFSSGNLRTLLIDEFGDDPDANPDFISITDAGVVTGILDGVSGELFFDVSVVDAGGAVILAVFRINFVDEFDLRFAQENLAGAQLGLNYATRIQTLGGDLNFDTFESTARFNVVPDSIDLGGQALDQLTEIGLTLSADGTLYGRPLQTGTLTFSVHAEDATDTEALSFAGGVGDQTFTVEIEDMAFAGSTFYCDGCIIRGTLARSGRDSIQVRGMADFAGQLLANLAGTPITLRVGAGRNRDGTPCGRTFSAVLDARGNAKKIVPDDPFTDENEAYSFRATVRANGRVSLNVTGTDLYEAVNADTLIEEPLNTVVLEVAFGNALHCEAVSALTKVTQNPYQLVYFLAAKGEQGQPLAGIFQTWKLKGRDIGQFVGNRGTAWTIFFSAAPRFGIDGSDLTGSGSATFRIGRNYDSSATAEPGNAFYEESVTLNTTRPQTYRYLRPKDGTEEITQATFQPFAFRHNVATSYIRDDVSGIPQAIVSGTPEVLQFEVEIGSARGATSRRLFPLSRAYYEHP